VFKSSTNAHVLDTSEEWHSIRIRGVPIVKKSLTRNDLQQHFNIPSMHLKSLAPRKHTASFILHLSVHCKHTN